MIVKHVIVKRVKNIECQYPVLVEVVELGLQRLV